MAAECSPILIRCLVALFPFPNHFFFTVHHGEPDRVRVVGGGEEAGVVAGVLQDGALDGQDAEDVVRLPHGLHPGKKTNAP